MRMCYAASDAAYIVLLRNIIVVLVIVWVVVMLVIWVIIMGHVVMFVGMLILILMYDE